MKRATVRLRDRADAALDVDLIVAADREHEARVFDALSTLPDQAVRELQPGELERYAVIRVADEILVDLMRVAGGIDYVQAAQDVDVRDVDGVAIPFASPRLLWRIEAVTHRGEGCGGPRVPASLVRCTWRDAARGVAARRRADSSRQSAVQFADPERRVHEASPRSRPHHPQRRAAGAV
jgi:hypothetical protein